MLQLDPGRRQEAVEAGWLAYQERMPEHELAYRRECEDWNVIAIASGSEVVGALFARDGVVHIGIVPAWRSRWASRGLIRAICKYGTATTLLPSESEQREFVRRAFGAVGLGERQ